MENWIFNATLSGAPQGGVASPTLSNIYLDQLDQFVEAELLPLYNRGDQRQRYRPYTKLLSAAQYRRQLGEHKEAKALRQQAQRLPSRDPQDPDFRRLWYVRYADDWLLGFSGPRIEAEQIKQQLAEYLRTELKLELSEQKTLITHARTEAARFLGYEIVNQQADCKQHRSLQRRCINGAIGLRVPKNVIKAKCAEYMRGGKPIHLAAAVHDTDYSIVAKYQATYRGIVQYYQLTYNVCHWNILHYVMRTSLAKTLAHKHKLSVRKVIRKYRTTVMTPMGERRVLAAIQHRGDERKALIAYFGGIELRRQKQAKLNDQPVVIFNDRVEVVQRLLAQQCELCGSTDCCEVHHIRKLTDLDQPGRKTKPEWIKRMAARRRKTLVVCRQCHHDIHHGRHSSQRIAA